MNKIQKCYQGQLHYENFQKNFLKEEIMNQGSGLFKRHENLSRKVEMLEKERQRNRTFQHKAELLKLKKEKLLIKEQIEKLTTRTN